MSWKQLSLLFDLPPEEDVFAWSEEDKDALREIILRDALSSILDGRNSRESKEELWRWICTETLSPFGFDACARTVGVDPHALRVAFGRLVERQVIKGDAEEELLEKTSRLLAFYLEEPAARSRGHAHHRTH